jgi:hypothetical protein
MPSKGNSPFKPMKDIKISEKGVEKELNRLNPCKATGPDKVPVRILKETANIITHILTKIYILINCDSKQMISYKAYLRLKSPHIHVTDTVRESIFPIMCISEKRSV